MYYKIFKSICLTLLWTHTRDAIDIQQYIRYSRLNTMKIPGMPGGLRDNLLMELKNGNFKISRIEAWRAGIVQGERTFPAVFRKIIDEATAVENDKKQLDAILDGEYGPQTMIGTWLTERRLKKADNKSELMSRAIGLVYEQDLSQLTADSQSFGPPRSVQPTEQMPPVLDDETASFRQ